MIEEFDLEERVAKAGRLFKEGGYNCCQAVVLAYCDLFGMDEKTAASLSSGFGGGMGRMREVCGSVSGMVMLSGMLSPADNPSDKAGRTANYALVQEVAGEFRNINGSIICRELLGLDKKPAEGQATSESPVPSDRTAEYYKKRPCEELVKISARIIGERIKNTKVL
ncbi:MAG: C-GCAxxG-C-C family protein [Bacteroidales bacterium]|nr:C-GCAxxG-C-C family protein [Bacteroidales bacterium]MDD5911989.1 C-GCAxxG-C-C family protein [Bacteroidales bacterium]